MKLMGFLLICMLMMSTLLIEVAAAANEESQLESSDENGGRNLTESQEDMENGRGGGRVDYCHTGKPPFTPVPCDPREKRENNLTPGKTRKKSDPRAGAASPGRPSRGRRSQARDSLICHAAKLCGLW
ncbi:unnamed protein product [Orchesella dallaii]|uniref:Uncharacterized protein n=1 Tax=Orchesella dallaii TaxID=48710 RepID=A0ABP1QZW3_9HEXA